MSDPLIRDIPSIKKMLEDAQNFKTLKHAMPFLRPLLRLLGVDVAAMDEALSGLDDLVKMTDEIATIPDRFDDIFAELGWIVYERNLIPTMLPKSC